MKNKVYNISNTIHLFVYDKVNKNTIYLGTKDNVLIDVITNIVPVLSSNVYMRKPRNVDKYLNQNFIEKISGKLMFTNMQTWSVQTYQVLQLRWKIRLELSYRVERTLSDYMIGEYTEPNISFSLNDSKRYIIHDQHYRIINPAVWAPDLLRLFKKYHDGILSVSKKRVVYKHRPKSHTVYNRGSRHGTKQRQMVYAYDDYGEFKNRVRIQDLGYCTWDRSPSRRSAGWKEQRHKPIAQWGKHTYNTSRMSIRNVYDSDFNDYDIDIMLYEDFISNAS